MTSTVGYLTHRTREYVFTIRVVNMQKEALYNQIRGHGIKCDGS